jgi:hypothetical protein
MLFPNGVLANCKKTKKTLEICKIVRKEGGKTKN